MLKNIPLVMLVLLTQLKATETDQSFQYVAQYAMQTARSKNFQDLAENLFSDADSRAELLSFLKRNNLLSRSLPDVVAEGSMLTIRERIHNSTLDLSQISDFKIKYNGHFLSFKGDEKYIDIYHRLLKKQPRRALYFWFLPEAEAALPVLSVVTLASYATAALRAEKASQEKRSLSSEASSVTNTQRQSLKVRKNNR